MITGEFLNLVASGLEQLDQRHREILLLRCVRDCSYEEIAYKLGICVGTVKSRVARARTSLLKRLVEACPEFAADAAPSDWLESCRPAFRSNLVPA